MTPEEEMRRAGKAKEIFDSEMFKEAVSTVEKALLDGIQRTAFIDDKLREKLCQRYASLHDVLGQLRTYVETGKLAEASMIEKAQNALRGAFR